MIKELKELILKANKNILEQEKHKPVGSKDDPFVCFCSESIYALTKQYLDKNNLFFNDYDNHWYKMIIVEVTCNE